MTDDDALRDARVLVTGGAGFIGRHLVGRLRDHGAEVTAPTSAESDLTDRAAVRRAVTAARPDVVFHLAAARARGTAGDRLRTAAVNAMSGLLLVESVPDSCRAIVHLGSSTEYARSAVPMGESAAVAPESFFGATKAAGALLVAAAAAERSLPCTLLRAFQVYGPGDKAHRLVPTVLDAARTGHVLPLTRPGLRRDWVWVGDVVDALVRAATTPTGTATVYPVGTGVQTTNEALVQVAERVTGRSIRTAVGALPDREWDTADWVADPSATRRDLGWSPQVGLEEGLRRCWEVAA